MPKRFLCLLLAVTLICGLGLNAQAVENQYAIYVDGEEVSRSYSLLEDGVTYVAAYFVAAALRPETQICWDNGNMLLTGADYTMTIRFNADYILCNGRYLYLPDKVRLHPETGDLMVPVRTLATALGAEVGWDAAGVTLTTGGDALESGENFYNAADVDLLARVIAHESRNQPLAGKIGVANAILNRVNSPLFPNTVSEVLNQKNQFPNATNATPTAECVIAAKLALDGANTVGNACWFNGVGKSCWASKNKTLIATIGGHAFYG